MTTWLRPSLNWLLPLVPVAIGLEFLAPERHALTFVLACVAIIPLAGWMGRATEELADRSGAAVGGLLNATFGNMAELIIALMALRAGLVEVVKASLTGSIIGNILLVLGAALLVGGLRHKVQTFNPTASRVGATLLALAVIALLIPGVTNLAGSRDDVPQEAKLLQDESLEVSFLLLFVYALSLLFTLHTHKQLYVQDPAATAEAHGEHQVWSVGKALGVLLAATVCVGFLAEFMVGSVQAAAKTVGLTELFVGVIVVAIVGNAAEHSTAVLVAWNNRMDLSLAIATGSSIQIALFAAPLLVLLSYAFGVPMNLLFTGPEIAAVAISVAVVTMIAGDGESNWLEGVLLLVVYAMLGVLFYHLPG